VIDFRPATEADADAWQAHLAATGSGDFLHDWAWADIAAFDGQPQRRYLLEQDGALVGIAAAQGRRLLRGREFWYVPHGPVLDYTDARAGERLRAMCIGLRNAATQHGAIAVKLEPRLASDDPSRAAFDGRGFRHRAETLQVGHTRIVELADDDTLLASFDKDTRYGVRGSPSPSSTIPRTNRPSTSCTGWSERRSDGPAFRCRRSSVTASPGTRWPGQATRRFWRRVGRVSCSCRAWSPSRAIGPSTSSAGHDARSRASRSATRVTRCNGP
jgi:hypothetical protein